MRMFFLPAQAFKVISCQTCECRNLLCLRRSSDTTVFCSCDINCVSSWFQSADPDGSQSGLVFQAVGHGRRGSPHVPHDKASAQGADGNQVG